MLGDDSKERAAESEKLARELAARHARILALSAQAHVLHGLHLKEITGVAALGPPSLKEYADSFTEKAAQLEAQVGPEQRDAMMAAVQAYSDKLGFYTGPPRKRPNARLSRLAGAASVTRAVQRSLDFATCASALRQEQIIATSMAMDSFKNDAESQRESEVDEYMHMLDAEVPDIPDLPAECQGRKAVLMKLPKRLLTAADSQPDDDSVLDFFRSESLLEVEEEDERTKYHSLKAVLPFVTPTGDVQTESIVDSGAARCALHYAYMKRKLPHLVEQLQPSSLKFRDASKNRMSLRGKVPIAIKIGSRTVRSTAYVFDELGANFLLGVNAMKANGIKIDFHTDSIYAPDDDQGVAAHSVACPICQVAEQEGDEADAPSTDASHADGAVEADGHWSHAGHTGCCSGCDNAFSVICDKDACTLVVRHAGEESTAVTCEPRRRVTKAQLKLDKDCTIKHGEVVTLDPLLVGARSGAPTQVELFTDLTLEKAGLEVDYSTLQNPLNERGVLRVRNCRSDRKPIKIPAGRVLATGGRPADAEPMVTVAAILDEAPAPALRGVDDGGIDDLAKLGFSLDKAIDPDKRRPDGSYEPLSDSKKRHLYEIALRWHYVWSTDAKVPKTSYLVVIDIPTGDAAPQATPAYGIPEKLRSAALAEVNKLLKAGLIEPSMSDWCSPALVRVKKDSTKEDMKIKFAIDYRRVNAVTRADAGGLGTQADILYGIGGKFKFLGLCDAAGGFYQFLLSPKSRHKSAFILPASMGGTLFQWRVAPYGLTRNPAGYSRGMQWVLKGLHDRRDLADADGAGTSMGGATSWLDDICMRANTFTGFCDLFNTVLERLAIAGMTLKGSKCELLHEAMDLLGFVATPHGLMIQKPKIEGIMNNGIPNNPKDAETFLGAVAFLRRMVPRISLLAAPMTDAIRKYKARKGTGRVKVSRRTKAAEESFSEEEQRDVDQSWKAVVEHLDGSAVVSSPDFEDPNAEFVMCTDASDFAVGGVLMQWQHDCVPGPGPPNDAREAPARSAQKPKYSDPLTNSWREKAGWKLHIIGYYSKTLDTAQRNYPAFDKEAGAILLCTRHWADLITYHPTTVYTDSSVATSMLTKHAAPPRLQRWGVELGSYLPHLKIAYRKGADNGLADLLSRFPAFKRFTSTREDTVELPDDLFEKIGEAPLFIRPSSNRNSSYLDKAVYSLYEPKHAGRVPEVFWCAHSAPEIPGRGMKDRFKPPSGEDDHIALDDQAVAMVAESREYDFIATTLQALGDHVHSQQSLDEQDVNRWASYVRIHSATYGRPPTVRVEADSQVADLLRHEAEMLGCTVQLADDTEDSPADVRIFCGGLTPEHEPLSPSKTIHLCPDRKHAVAFVTIAGAEVAVDADFSACLPPDEPCRGLFAPSLRLRSLIAQAVAHAMHDAVGIPLESRDEESFREAMDHWATYGYGVPFVQHQPKAASPAFQMVVEAGDDEVLEVDGSNAREEVPTTPVTENAPRTRKYDWQDKSSWVEGDPVPPCDPSISPTVPITLADQRRDPKLRILISSLEGDRRVPKATRDRTADKYKIDADGLMKIINRDGEAGYALVVPRAFRAAILARYHYTLTDGSGHAGGDLMYQRMRDSYYWSDMEEECHTFAQACQVCGGTRSQPTFNVPTASAPTPSKPFEVIHVDHKSGLPLSGGYAHVLVVVCALTRFTLYIPVRSATAAATFDALITHVFSIFGNPLVIISDNGRSFHNKLMQASEKLYGYRWVYVVPHTPQANGLAEAAVKKLKLIFDRHTDEYREWHRIVPMAQAAVNQRITSGTGATPFVSLFGRPPVTLAALELPALLPDSTPEQREVRLMGLTMAKLHERLQRASDDVKAAARAAEKTAVKAPRRQVLPGDKLWLVYSDSERSRYLRKHGHGKPWKHAFVVKRVKPHAVMLEVPGDGSVPDVLPWQSLRKCSFAAPHFHDEDMPLPASDSRGLTVVDDPDPGVVPDAAEAVDDWVSWSATPTYEIDRILSARRVGSGWTLSVSWKGYPDPTSEALSSILKDTQHPEVLADIARCQNEYLAQHPSERADFREDVPRPEPTRVQPGRARNRPSNFTFAVCGVSDNAHHSELLSSGLKRLTRGCALRSRVLRSFQPDFCGLVSG